MSELIDKSFIKAADNLWIKKYYRQIESELSLRLDLQVSLQEKKKSFIIWAAKERLIYESNIDEEVKDFIENKFNNRKRAYHKNAKEWIKKTKYVFERDSFTCQYCGKVGGRLECDHIVPFSKGGSDELDNLLTACRKCNRSKKDKSEDQFRKYLKSLSYEKQSQLL